MPSHQSGSVVGDQNVAATALMSSDFRLYTHFFRTGHKGNYIAGLDGLRAVSVIMVIIGHAGFGGIVPAGLGVTIFFFISGFLICNILCSEIARNQSIELGKFYIRRFLRLSPELYFYVFVAMAVSILLRYEDLPRFVPAFVYLQNYYEIFMAAALVVVSPLSTGHFWSLAVEEHFYLLFPSLMQAYRANLRAFIWTMVAWCAFAPFLRMMEAATILPDFLTSGASTYTYLASEARIDSILYGCILALLCRTGLRGRDLDARSGYLLLGAAAMLIALSLSFRNVEFRSTFRYSMQGIALLLGFYGLYFSSPGAKIIAILEYASLRFLGRLSYGMYIWHLAVIKIIAKLMPYSGKTAAVMALPLVFGITIGIAWISNHFILGQVQSLRLRFHSR